MNNTESPASSSNSKINTPRVNRPTAIIQTKTKQEELPKPKPTERQHLSRTSEKEGPPLGQKTDTMSKPVTRGMRKERNVTRRLICPPARTVVPRGQSR